MKATLPLFQEYPRHEVVELLKKGEMEVDLQCNPFAALPVELKAYIFEFAIDKHNYDTMLEALQGSKLEYIAHEKHKQIFLQLSEFQHEDLLSMGIFPNQPFGLSGYLFYIPCSGLREVSYVETIRRATTYYGIPWVSYLIFQVSNTSNISLRGFYISDQITHALRYLRRAGFNFEPNFLEIVNKSKRHLITSDVLQIH